MSPADQEDGPKFPAPRGASLPSGKEVPGLDGRATPAVFNATPRALRQATMHQRSWGRLRAGPTFSPLVQGLLGSRPRARRSGLRNRRNTPCAGRGGEEARQTCLDNWCPWAAGEADFLPQAGGGVGGGGAPKLCARGRATLRLSLHTFRPLPQDVGRDCGHVSSS